MGRCEGQVNKRQNGGAGNGRLIGVWQNMSHDRAVGGRSGGSATKGMRQRQRPSVALIAWRGVLHVICCPALASVRCRCSKSGYRHGVPASSSRCIAASGHCPRPPPSPTPPSEAPPPSFRLHRKTIAGGDKARRCCTARVVASRAQRAPPFSHVNDHGGHAWCCVACPCRRPFGLGACHAHWTLQAPDPGPQRAAAPRAARGIRSGRAWCAEARVCYPPSQRCLRARGQVPRSSLRRAREVHTVPMPLRPAEQRRPRYGERTTPGEPTCVG